MSPKLTISVLFPFLALVAIPGCGVTELKNTNRRLKEANDRLVAENNRLEQELAASEKEVTEKNKLLDDAQRTAKDVGAVPPLDPLADGKAEGKGKTKGKKKELADAFPDEELLDLPGVEKDAGVSIHRTKQGTLFRLDEKVFFPMGKATLSEKGRAALAKVAKIINSRYQGRLIRVEGHTDDVPVSKVKNQYPSNWELSTARACAVVRYLTTAKVSPKQVYPAGFSQYKPLTSARTAGARSQNRRVEIIVLNEKIS